MYSSCQALPPHPPLRARRKFQERIKWACSVFHSLSSKGLSVPVEQRDQTYLPHSKRPNRNNRADRQGRIWTGLLGKVARPISGSKEVPEEARLQEQTYWTFYRRGTSHQSSQSPLHSAIYGNVYLWQLICDGHVVFVRRQPLRLSTQKERKTKLKPTNKYLQGRVFGDGISPWEKRPSLWLEKLQSSHRWELECKTLWFRPFKNRNKRQEEKQKYPSGYAPLDGAWDP